MGGHKPPVPIAGLGQFWDTPLMTLRVRRVDLHLFLGACIAGKYKPTPCNRLRDAAVQIRNFAVTLAPRSEVSAQAIAEGAAINRRLE